MWSGPVVLLLSPVPVRGKWFHLAFRASWFYQQWPLSSSLSLKLSPFTNAVFSYPPLPSTSLLLLSKYTGLSNSLFAMPSPWGAPNVGLIPAISQLHLPPYHHSHITGYDSELKPFIFVTLKKPQPTSRFMSH